MIILEIIKWLLIALCVLGWGSVFFCWALFGIAWLKCWRNPKITPAEIMRRLAMSPTELLERLNMAYPSMDSVVLAAECREAALSLKEKMT